MSLERVAPHCEGQLSQSHSHTCLVGDAGSERYAVDRARGSSAKYDKL